MADNQKHLTFLLRAATFFFSGWCYRTLYIRLSWLQWLSVSLLFEQPSIFAEWGKPLQMG
jgi:hypothetical protein